MHTGLLPLTFLPAAPAPTTQDQLDEFRATRARRVSLPPALPAFVGHSRLLLN